MEVEVTGVLSNTVEHTSQLMEQDLRTLGGQTQPVMEKLRDGVEHLIISRNEKKHISGNQKHKLRKEEAVASNKLRSSSGICVSGQDSYQ